MNYRYTLLALALASSTALVACNKSDPAKAGAAGAGAGQQMPPAVVNVMPVKFESVPLVKLLAGRTVALQQATVLPQASGILEQQLFKDGDVVRQGQPLYRINQDNYKSALGASQAQLQQSQASIGTAQANLENAKATLKSAQAQLKLAEANFNRLKNLRGMANGTDAISKQEYDVGAASVETARASVENAQAQIGVMNANVAAAKAASQGVAQTLAGNKLNFDRTTVVAPISGRTSRSAITIGGLVTAGQTQLNTISRDDIMYVDISQSSTEILEFQKQMQQGKLQAARGAPIRLTLQDGSVYPIMGQLSFEEQKVDPTTGAVTLRAAFKNNGSLIPGMYVNAELIQGMVNNAVLLPQSAVNRTPKGDVTVYVVDANNKVQVRPVTVAGTYQGKWIITGGLQEGESVVIIGGAKVKPDQAVMPKPITSDMLASSATGTTPAPAPSNAPVASSASATAAAASPNAASASANTQPPAAVTEKTTTQTTTTTTVAPAASSTKQ